MDVFKEMRTELETVLDQLKSEGVLSADIDTSRATMEPPRDASHGDMATNAAMVMAKVAGMKPRDLAEKIWLRQTALLLLK